MKKITSALITIALSTQIAFPAFATGEQQQKLALSTLSVEVKQQLLNSATRLEKHLAGMSEASQKRFSAKVLSVLDRAEAKMNTMSDETLEARAQAFAKNTNVPVAAATEATSTEDTADLTEVSNELNQSTVQTPSETVDTATVDQALQSVIGDSFRTRAVSMIDNVREHVTGLGGLIFGLYTVIILVILLPLIIGVVVGMLSGAFLIPVLIGGAVTLGIIIWVTVVEIQDK